MELKLSVSIGATLQVKNARGEWDWIKPEVGCEIKLIDGEVTNNVTEAFADMWDNVVGPQFNSVVQELLTEQIPAESTEKVSEEPVDKEATTTDEDEYY